MGDETPEEDAVAINERFVESTEPDDRRTQNSEIFLETQRSRRDDRDIGTKCLCIQTLRKRGCFCGTSHHDLERTLRECLTLRPNRSADQKCQRHIQDLIGKHEIKKEELSRREKDLYERINMLECSMPTVMVWKIWKVTQGVQTAAIHHVVKTLLRDTFSKTRGCPCASSLQDDYKVGEIQVSSKEAECRGMETCPLWMDKERVHHKKHQEPSIAKEKIEKLTIGAQNAAETLKAQADAMNDESSEADRSLENSPSLISVRSADIDCLKRLRELAETEIAIKRRIVDLERREFIYVKTLKLSNDLWERLENDPVLDLQKRYDEITRDNQEMVSQIYDLKDELEKSKQEKREYCKANELAKKRLGEANHGNQELLDEVSKLKEELEKSNEEKQELSEANKLAQTRLDQASQENLDMADQISKLKDEIENSKREKQEFRKMSELAKKGLEDDLEKLNLEKEHMKDTSDMLIKRLEDDLKQAMREKDELWDKYVNLQKERDDLQQKNRENEHLKSDLDRMNKERQQLLDKNADLEKERKDLLRKNDDNKHMKNELDRLNQEKKQLLDKNERLEKERDDLNRKNEENQHLKSEIERINKEKKYLLDKNADLKKERDDLNKDKNDLFDKNTNLRKERDDFYRKSRESQDIKNDLERIIKERRRLSENNASLQKRLKDEIDKANREKQEQLENWDQMKKQYESDLEKMSLEKQKLIKKTEAISRHAKHDIDKITKEFQFIADNNKAAIKRLENLLEKFKADNEQLSKANSELKKRLDEELRKFNNEKQQLLESIENLKKQNLIDLKRMEMDKKQLKEEMDAMNREKQRILQDNKSSEKKLEFDLEKLNTETKRLLDMIAAIRKQNKDEIDRLTDEKQRLLVLNEQLTIKFGEELEQANQEKKILSDAHDAAKKRIETLTRETQKLSDESEQMKKQCKDDLETANQEYQVLSEQYEALKQQLASELLKLQQEKQQLLAESEQKTKKLKEEFDKVYSQNTKLSQINLDDKKHFENELNVLKQEKQQLMETSEVEKKNLENDIERLHRISRDLTEMNDVLRVQHQDELDKINLEKQQSLETSEQVMKTLQSDLDDVNIENKQLKDELNTEVSENRRLSTAYGLLEKDLMDSKVALSKYADMEREVMGSSSIIVISGSTSTIGSGSEDSSKKDSKIPLIDLVSDEDIAGHDVSPRKGIQKKEPGKHVKYVRISSDASPEEIQKILGRRKSKDSRDPTETKAPEYSKNQAHKSVGVKPKTATKSIGGRFVLPRETQDSGSSNSSNSFVCGPDVKCWDSDDDDEPCPPDFNCNDCLEFDQEQQAFVSPVSMDDDSQRQNLPVSQDETCEKSGSKKPVIDFQLPPQELEVKKSSESKDDEICDDETCRPRKKPSEPEQNIPSSGSGKLPLDVKMTKEQQPEPNNEEKWYPKKPSKLDVVEKLVEERLQTDVCLCRPLAQMLQGHGKRIEPCGRVTPPFVPESESARSISQICSCIGKSKYKEVGGESWSATLHMRTTTRSRTTVVDSTVQTEFEIKDSVCECDYCGKPMAPEEIIEIPSDHLLVSCPCESKRHVCKKQKPKTQKPEISVPETSGTREGTVPLSQSSCSCFACKCDETDEKSEILSNVSCEDETCQRPTTQKILKVTQATETDPIQSRDVGTSCNKLTIHETLLYNRQIQSYPEDGNSPINHRDIVNTLENRQLIIHTQMLRAREIERRFLEDTPPIIIRKRDQYCSVSFPQLNKQAQPPDKIEKPKWDFSPIKNPNLQKPGSCKCIPSNEKSKEVFSACNCASSGCSQDSGEPTTRGICKCDSDE